MKIFLLAPLVFLAACASSEQYTDYALMASATEQQRLKTIQEISKQGQGGVVAAALLMQTNSQRIAPPESVGDKALKWASILVPGVVGLAQIQSNENLGVVRSNNNTAVAINTNETMAGIAEATIVDPVIVEQPDPVIVQPTE